MPFDPLCPLSDHMELDKNTKYKRCFMYMNKEENGREDFEELDLEAESKS